MTLLAFTLAAAALLAPGRDHTVLSTAIASRVDAERPLFRADADKRKTAALLVAVAFRESSLRVDAVGDHGRSFCAFQIHQTSGGTKALLTDANACVAKAFTMLRESVRIDGAHPVAFYARGPGWRSDVARRLSRDRMALAARLLRDVAIATTAATEAVTPAPTGLRTPIDAASRHADRIRAARASWSAVAVLGGAS